MRPLNDLGKRTLDNKAQLRNVINDITANRYRINQYIGDNPKRADAKDCKCHSSWYPCEYCYGKGIKIVLTDNNKARERILQQKTLIEEKIAECESLPDTPNKQSKIENLNSLKEELNKSVNSLSRKSNILWPFSTMGSEHRSRKSILEIVSKIEQNIPLTIDEAKGIKGRSLLLDIPNFNYVYDAPAEYMHSGCLGVGKRLTELTFDVGVKRTRITKRPLSSSKKFDDLMSITKVVNEFARRARSLNLAIFKAQEYRNLVIFFFPISLNVLKMMQKKGISGYFMLTCYALVLYLHKNSTQ